VAIRGVLRVHNCNSHGIAELVSDILIPVPKKLKISNNRRYSRWFCTGYFMKTIGSLRFLKITGMDSSVILIILPKNCNRWFFGSEVLYTLELVIINKN
jgi:hypothetical protein